MSDHVDGPRSIGDPLRISRISSRSRAQRTPHAPFSCVHVPFRRRRRKSSCQLRRKGGGAHNWLVGGTVLPGNQKATCKMILAAGGNP